MPELSAQSSTGITQANEEISLTELFHILWFRRRLLFSTAFFIIAVGVVYLNQLVPRYSASSSIMISTPKGKVVNIDDVLAGAIGNDAEILGEIEILQSRGLAKKVIDRLDLISRDEFNPKLRPKGLRSYLSPSQWVPDGWKESLGMKPKQGVVLTEEEQAQLETAIATDIFLAKLDVAQVKYSNVARVTFQSTDPRMAAAIANELPEAYIIDQMEAKFEATEKTTKWLDQQLSELRQKVEDSERAVEIYRNQHGLSEAKGINILSSQISEINSQLVIARAERVQAEARLKQVKRLMQGSRSDLESASEVLASPLIQRLKEQASSVTRKASELSVEYGPKHPKMLQVNAQIADIQNRIKQEIQKIAAGLQNEVDVARSKENSLSSSLNDLEQKVGAQKSETVQLSVLEREAIANRTLFDTFLNRFKETSSTTSMQEADARVISEAEVPMGASFPNKRLMLILIVSGACFISVVLVYLVHTLNPGLMNPEQIEKELGFPTIGMIPTTLSDRPYDYVLEKPQSSFAEALNTLKTALILSGPDEAVKAIQITSSVPEEGKSTLAIAFARLLSKSGHKVLLVDGDLRRATLEKKLGITRKSQGLTDLVMSGEGKINDFICEDEKSGTFVMPKGGAEFVNATDIFSSHRMQSIIETLKQSFDYVIIDTPPVMSVSDARIIGKIVDKTLFVVHWDKTPKNVIKAALQQLKEGKTDIAGCVLQRVNLKRYGTYGYGDSGYYYHYGRYGHYYSN